MQSLKVTSTQIILTAAASVIAGCVSLLIVMQTSQAAYEESIALAASSPVIQKVLPSKSLKAEMPGAQPGEKRWPW